MGGELVLDVRITNRLTAHGFQQVAQTYYPESFGNATIRFVNEVLQLEIVRDRSVFWAEIGPTGQDDDKMVPLQHVFGALKIPYHKFSNLIEQIVLFNRNYDTVAAQYSPDRFDEFWRMLNRYMNEQFTLHHPGLKNWPDPEE